MTGTGPRLKRPITSEKVMENIKPGDRMQHTRTGEPFRFASLRGEMLIASDGKQYPQSECRFIGDTGFIPFADAASTTDEGRALLAEIHDTEIESANISSRVLFGRDVNGLDLLRLRRIVSDLKHERREQRATPGTCWQCGNPVAAGGLECRPCHEGINRASYTRMMAGQFLAEPGRLPRWV